MSRDMLKASARTQVGSNAVRKLRNTKLIPGVLYGHHIESQSLSVTTAELEKFFKKHGVGAGLDLELDGTKVFTVLKNVQIDYFKNEFLHVEFQALSAGEKIKLKVPLVFLNKDTIPAGQVVQEMHHEIELHVLPKDLIERIEIDVIDAKLGDHLTVADLDIAKNDAYEIMDQLDTIIYSISEAKIHVEEEETDETVAVSAEVPVIGEEE